jgi:hypothetical protein
MAQGENALPSADNTIEHFPLASPPSTPASTRLERGGDSHEKPSLLSPQKQWGISSMWWGSPKDDRVVYQCILMPVVLSMLLFFNNFYSCATYWYLCAEYGLLCCRQRLYKGKYSHYVERLWVQKRGRPQC